MKLTISITGHDERHLAERAEQLVRARLANSQPPPEQDAPPPSAQQQPSDRRS